jgi:hypothetical protein
MQTEELGRLKVSKEPTGNWKRDTVLGNSVICDSVGANNQNKYLADILYCFWWEYFKVWSHCQTTNDSLLIYILNITSFVFKTQASRRALAEDT